VKIDAITTMPVSESMANAMANACGKSKPKRDLFNYLFANGRSSISKLKSQAGKATGAHLREMLDRKLVIRIKNGVYEIAPDYVVPLPPVIPDPAPDDPRMAIGTKLAFDVRPYAGCSTGVRFGRVTKKLGLTPKNEQCFRIETVGKTGDDSVSSRHSSTTRYYPNWDKPNGSFIVKLHPSSEYGGPSLHIPSYTYASVGISIYDSATSYSSFSDFGD
jgi:hypothetical protein